MRDPVPVEVVALVQKEKPDPVGRPLATAGLVPLLVMETGITIEGSMPEIFTGGRKAAAFKAINFKKVGKALRSNQPTSR
jgi:hypothetical protein